MATQKNRNKRFKCMDCSRDTGRLNEHYMLIDKTWYAVHPHPIGMLCIACCEIRLGRPLIPQDFKKCYLNKLDFGKKSELLISRLKGQ